MQRAGSITRRSVCRLLGIFPCCHFTAFRSSTATTGTAPRNEKPDTSSPSSGPPETATPSNDRRFEACRGVVEKCGGGDVIVRLEDNDVGVDRFVDERPPDPAIVDGDDVTDGDVIVDGHEIVDGDEVIVLFEDGYPRITIRTPLGER